MQFPPSSLLVRVTLCRLVTPVWELHADLGWGGSVGVAGGASGVRLGVWLWAWLGVHRGCGYGRGWGLLGCRFGADVVWMSAPGSFWGLDGTEVLCFRRWEEVRGVKSCGVV